MLGDTHTQYIYIYVHTQQIISPTDDPVQITLHQISDDVYVLEVDGVGGEAHHVLDCDDVLVRVEVPEQLDLPQNSLCVDQILEGVLDLLDGDLSLGLRVRGGHHEAIAAVADLFQIGVASINHEGPVGSEE